MSKVLFQAIQLSSIWLIDRTLSGATTQGQSGPGSNGNEGVARIAQISSITDCLVLYTGHSLFIGAGVLPLRREAVNMIPKIRMTLIMEKEKNCKNYVY